MVLDYADHGSLRNYLDTNYDELSWDTKFSNLCYIVGGLLVGLRKFIVKN